MLWIYRNYPLVTEQFARRRPYKRSKENRKAVKGFLAENWRLKWACRLSQMLIEFSEKILKRSPTKKTVEPLLKDEHKAQRKKFANWARKKFQKEHTMRIFFLMKKCLILTISITVKMIVYGPLIGRKQIGEVDKNNNESLHKKVMVWLAVCLEGVAPLALFEKGTLDHHRYIKEVLPVALRYSNSKYRNNWTFQQDNGIPHTHQETQEWCSQHFPLFIDKDTWPTKSPDLNPLDYCI